MPRERSERGLATAPVRQTPNGAVADLVNIQGLRLYVYPDGHMNLSGGDGDGYPFDSIAEFGAALMELLRRVEVEARRGRG
ncbi:MAG: hypothetical protein ACRDHS_02595 [Actinomycetota bacterium]